MGVYRELNFQSGIHIQSIVRSLLEKVSNDTVQVQFVNVIIQVQQSPCEHRDSEELRGEPGETPRPRTVQLLNWTQCRGHVSSVWVTSLTHILKLMYGDHSSHSSFRCFTVNTGYVFLNLYLPVCHSSQSDTFHTIFLCKILSVVVLTSFRVKWKSEWDVPSQ